jgi:hypothetical protein
MAEPWRDINDPGYFLKPEPYLPTILAATAQLSPISHLNLNKG